MARVAYQGPYANMEFAPYAFREYPKQVTLADGTVAVAESQRHELDLMADAPPPAPHPAEEELLKLKAELEELRKHKDELAERLAEHE